MHLFLYIFVMKLNVKTVAISVFLSLGLIGCTRTSVDSKFSVVTTTFPCYDAARAVLGNILKDSDISLKLLVKPGTEVHSYDPTPQDIIAIQKANLFIYIGGESDEWVEKLISSSQEDFKARELKLIDTVETLGEFDNPNEEDEHIWTSPLNEKLIVEAVCSALKEILSSEENAELLECLDQNAGKYIAQVNATEQRITDIVSSSSNKKIVMADRFPFVYFADYYGLSFKAAFSGCSTAVEASTSTIAELINTVKEENLSAVYYIELGNHKLADNVAEASGVPALLLQSVQNVTKDDFDKSETWVSLMNKNADALSKGLK